MVMMIIMSIMTVAVMVVAIMGMPVLVMPMGVDDNPCISARRSCKRHADAGRQSKHRCDRPNEGEAATA
jgi:hypothetical protein